MKARLLLPALLTFSVFATSYSASAQTTNRDDAYSNGEAREYSEDRNGDYIENDGNDNGTYNDEEGYVGDNGYAEDDVYKADADQGQGQYGYEERDNNNSQDYNNDAREYGNDPQQYNGRDAYAYRQQPNGNCQDRGYARGGSGYFQFPGGSVAINSGRHGFVRARMWVAGHWDYAPNGRRFWIPGHYSSGRANW